MNSTEQDRNNSYVQKALRIAWLIVGSLSYSVIYILGEIRTKDHGYEMLNVLAVISAVSCFLIFAIVFAVCRVPFLKWLSTTLIVLLVNFLLMAAWVNWGV